MAKPATANTSNQVVLSKVSRDKPVDPKAQARLNEINASNQPMMTSTVNAPEGSTSKTLLQKTGPQTKFANGLGEAHTGSIDVTHTSKRDNRVYHEGISVNAQGPGVSAHWGKTHESGLGTTTAHADAKVSTQGHAHAAVTADLSSLKSARLEADVNARASAEAKVSADVSHKVNDSVDARVGVNGKATAYAVAHAGAVVDVPNKNFGVHLGAGAGADASANVTADLHLGPVRDHLEVGVVAGVGARAELEAGIRDGKISLRTDTKGSFIHGLHVGNTITIESEHLAKHLEKHRQHSTEKHDLEGGGDYSIKNGLRTPMQTATAVAARSAVPPGTVPREQASPSTSPGSPSAPVSFMEAAALSRV